MTVAAPTVMADRVLERKVDRAANRASPPKSTLSDSFRKFSSAVSSKLGSHWAFIIALGTVLVWGLTGPIFHYSMVWQLVINTGTTIVTFLMVFVIQSTQNRDAKAFHLKLDELIRSGKGRNVFADLEDASEEELARFQHEFEALHDRARKKRKQKT
jgi:low affinity Fe/Cu permease